MGHENKRQRRRFTDEFKRVALDAFLHTARLKVKVDVEWVTPSGLPR